MRKLTGFPPKAYLIGAMKAGTTFLAGLLSQHPEICLARAKEPGFYTRNWDRGLEWYKSQFHEIDGKVLLDATCGYSSSPIPELQSVEKPQTNNKQFGVPERIHSIAPDARFIYILRNPVTRTYSNYWHNVRIGYEARDFRSAIEESNGYLYMSDYHSQLKQYLEYFKLDNFLLLLHEDLTTNPVMIARKCFNFLGIDEDFTVQVKKTGKNKAFVYSSAGNRLDTLFKKAGGLDQIINIIRPAIPESLRWKLSRLLLKSIPPISEEDKDFLTEYFEPKNRLLHALTGISLEKWKTR